MRLYRNWPAICALSNHHLMLFAATANEEERAKLALGYPELFTEEKPEQDGPWPLSVIRRVLVEKKTEEDGVHEILERELGLICIAVEGSLKLVFHGEAMPISDDEGREISRLWDEGYDTFPEKTHRVTINGVEYYLGMVDNANQTHPQEVNAFVYLCSLVDENA
jgi:hypothetical protein